MHMATRTNPLMDTFKHLCPVQPPIITPRSAQDFLKCAFWLLQVMRECVSWGICVCACVCVCNSRSLAEQQDAPSSPKQKLLMSPQ